MLWPTPRRLAIVVGVGLLAVLAAGGFFFWIERFSQAHANIAGLPRDPAWLERERLVSKHVQNLLAHPPRLDRERPHPMEDVPSNERPDSSGYGIAEDHRVYDLRNWKPVVAIDSPQTAGVTMTRTLRLSKSAPIERIDFLGRTSGAELMFRCETPNPDKARLFRSLARPKINGQEMTEHRLSVDVSDIPVGKEFTLVTRTTYWNSLQTPEEQWLGATGSDGSKLLSLLILFPESRPFKGGELQLVQPDDKRIPYDGPRLIFPDPKGAWVYWEVPGPLPGHSYRIDWKW